MKNIAIILADSNGCYPVPAVHGGAVSTLVEHIVAGNSVLGNVKLTIFTYDDEKARRAAEKYQHVDFVWIKIPAVIKLLDSAFFKMVGLLFKKKKGISFKSIFSLLWAICRLSVFLKSQKFDDVVIENNIPLAWCIKMSNYRGRYFYHLHNVPRINAKCKVVFENCTGFLCVSNFVASEIGSSKNAIGPVNKDKRKVLYNCIDVNHFKHISSTKKEIRSKYGLKNEDKVLVFVGRMSREKGIDRLLESLQYIRSKDVKILVVGSLIYDSNSSDEYSSLVRKFAERWKEKIVFTGYVSQKDLPAVYSAADIAVLPSVWNEPAGLTMLESMACEIPLITTNVGGISEYVQDKAIILENNSELPYNIAQNVDRLLRDENLRRRMGVVGRQHVCDHFSSEMYMSHFCNLLTDERE